MATLDVLAALCAVPGVEWAAHLPVVHTTDANGLWWGRPVSTRALPWPELGPGQPLEGPWAWDRLPTVRRFVPCPLPTDASLPSATALGRLCRAGPDLVGLILAGGRRSMQAWALNAAYEAQPPITVAPGPEMGACLLDQHRPDLDAALRDNACNPPAFQWLARPSVRAFVDQQLQRWQATRQPIRAFGPGFRLNLTPILGGASPSIALVLEPLLSPPLADLFELSPALRGVLRSIVAGATLPEIARDRRSTVSTVKTQRRHAYRHLGIGSRQEAVLLLHHLG